MEKDFEIYSHSLAYLASHRIIMTFSRISFIHSFIAEMIITERLLWFRTHSIDSTDILISKSIYQLSKI